MPAFEEFAETYGTTSARKASLDTPLVAKINGRKYLSVLQGGSSSEIANQVQKFPTVIFQNGKGLSTTFGSRKTNADLLHGGWSAFLEGSGTFSSDESAGSSMEEWLVSDSETVSNYGSDLEGGSDMGIEQEAQQLLAEFPYDKNLLSSNTQRTVRAPERYVPAEEEMVDDTDDWSDDEDDEEDDEWEGETDYDIDWDYGVRGEHLEEEELLSGGEGIQARDVPACESLEDLDMVLKADKVLLLVHASWCGFCKDYLPQFNQFCEENPDLTCATVDLPKLKEGPTSDALEVINRMTESFPTLLVCTNGECVKYEGIRSNFDELRNFVESQ